MVMGDSKQAREEEEELASASRGEEEDDGEDGYFSGYAHFSIHHDMLAVLLENSWLHLVSFYICFHFFAG